AILGGTLVPAADVHAVLDRGVLSGTTTVYEPGAPVDGRFAFEPRDGLRFDAKARIDAIHAAPRIAGPVDGSARVHVAGNFKDGALDATVDGSFSGLKTKGNVSVADGSVTGRVSGPIGALTVDANASARNMVAGGYDFETVKAHAHGPLATPRLEADLED